MSKLTAPIRPKSPSRRPRVVIVGGGFGGLNAAKGVGDLPVDVTVLDRSNHHTFQPLLYQVALAVLSPADIAQPIRTILRRQQNTEVLMDEVVGIDVQARQVALASGTNRLRLPGASPRARPTPTSATTTGRRSRRASKPLKMPPKFAAACFSPSNSPSGQMLEHGWHPPLNFLRHRRRPHRRRAGRRHQRHRPALHAPRFPPHRSRRQPACC